MTGLRRRQMLAFGVLLAAGSAALIAEMGTYARNTPENHPEWVHGKLLTSAAVIGGYEGYATRNLLRRNRLNLDEWHGFNEFLLNEVCSLGELAFSFALAENAYLYAELDRTAEGFDAVRFCRSAEQPSALVHVAADGLITSVQPFSDLSISPGWHRVELRATAAQLAISLDGRSLAPLSVAPLPAQVIGFRGGLRSAQVDDVLVRDADGRTVVDEDFRNDRHWWRAFGVAFAAVVLVAAAALWFGHRLGASAKKTLFVTAGSGLVCAGLLAGCFAFDWFVWSGRYPYAASVPWGRGEHAPQVIERARRTLATLFSPLDAQPSVSGPRLNAAIEERYRRIKTFLGLRPRKYLGGCVQIARTENGATVMSAARMNAAAVRRRVEGTDAADVIDIAYLGTSQTFGAGALREEDKLVPQIHTLLAAQRPDLRFVSWNGSIEGSTSGQLLVELRTVLCWCHPDVIVVNLSNNDPGEGFAQNLRAIADEAARLDAALLFVQEANTAELGFDSLAARHAEMLRVARERGLPCFDLHARMREHWQQDRGILWWDTVHMTSCGQRLAAEALAPAISGLVRARSK